MLELLRKRRSQRALRTGERAEPAASSASEAAEVRRALESAAEARGTQHPMRSLRLAHQCVQAHRATPRKLSGELRAGDALQLGLALLDQLAKPGDVRCATRARRDGIHLP
ncbi:MAG: hypothetical protein E6J86_08955 [Deltaproteobacteria bacterium]|nr:MAG: hypothetical protein E6J86_08955 [Deltaproteobacteria bacterium]